MENEITKKPLIWFVKQILNTEICMVNNKLVYLSDKKEIDNEILEKAQKLQIEDYENEKKLHKKKNIKNTLNNLTVTNKLGKTFYVDPISRIDIEAAINRMIEKDLDKIKWKLAKEYENSKIVYVTLDELKEVSELALLKKGELIGVINED